LWQSKLLPETEPNPANPAASEPALTDTSFFGHPRGLATLFFTEMWERFSYYGMRALLILFMKATAAQGGLGFDPSKRGIILGIYTSSVYLLSLPGGWIADRLLGARRAVFWGGVLIAAGQFCLVPEGIVTFYLGLLLIVLGTGLLKPNVSTIVGFIYSPGDRRRDAGFSIFYMGINIGAFLAPLICGWIAQRPGHPNHWHIAFGISGIGMVLGLIQYVAGARHLGSAGMEPSDSRGAWKAAGIGLAIVAAVAGLGVTVVFVFHVEVTAQLIGDAFGFGLLGVAVAVFAWLILGPGWTPLERKRSLAILVLFIAACVFWSGFEQASGTLNLFAAERTNNVIFGFKFPPSWYQALNSIFLVSFAPVFAWLWIRLGRREPSSPTKFGFGLVFVGLGFTVLVPAALIAGPDGFVTPAWLVFTYLFHTWGELSLSPVGLSAMTKLAPRRVAGVMMGVWFLSISVGNYLGGRAASLYATLPLPQLFGAVAAFAFVAAIILFAIVKPTVRLMSGVK
jgi:POT family proton-dependent oligopeptide transporter